MTELEDPRVIDVLLVEDDEGDVLMTREAFEYYKIQNRLHVVGDGEQALQFLRRTGPYADAPRPGLILLDVNLPRRGGMEVLAELKQDDELLMIPVIMLTTSQAEEDIVRSYSLHANAFISKPVDFEHFIDAIRQIDTFFLTLVKLRSDPGSHRDAHQGPAFHHVHVDAGQVVPRDGRAAPDHQVSRMAGYPVAGRGDQPAHDHPPLPGPGHRDQLAFGRPVYLRQVQGDLGAPGLGHQADGPGHPRARIGGRVQLTGQRQRWRRGRAAWGAATMPRPMPRAPCRSARSYCRSRDSATPALRHGTISHAAGRRAPLTVAQRATAPATSTRERRHREPARPSSNSGQPGGGSVPGWLGGGCCRPGQAAGGVDPRVHADGGGSASLSMVMVPSCSPWRAGDHRSAPREPKPARRRPLAR
jgi:CheY-like chemotaxis protein